MFTPTSSLETGPKGSVQVSTEEDEEEQRTLSELEADANGSNTGSVQCQFTGDRSRVALTT